MSNELQENQNRPSLHRNFAFILYPEDPKHEWVLQHVCRYPKLYRAVYILHDRDTWDWDDWDKFLAANEGQEPNWKPGELKKAHYHVMISWPNATSASAISKRLACVYTEAVTDRFAYVQYMLHDGFMWLDKFQYPVESLKGDARTISSLKSKMQIL